jgi:hypothetical protein
LFEFTNEEPEEILARPEKSQHNLIFFGYALIASSPFWNDLVRLSEIFIAAIVGSILTSAKKLCPMVKLHLCTHQMIENKVK